MYEPTSSKSLGVPPSQADEDTTTAPGIVLDLLSDDHVRTILNALADGAKPAQELIVTCDASKPAVYRRLNRLEENGLVESSTALHPDGHHRKEFTAGFERMTVDVDSGGISAEIEPA